MSKFENQRIKKTQFFLDQLSKHIKGVAKIFIYTKIHKRTMIYGLIYSSFFFLFLTLF